MHSRDYKYSQTRPLKLSSLLCIWHKFNWNIPDDRNVTFFQVFWVNVYVTQGISIKNPLPSASFKTFTWETWRESFHMSEHIFL